MPTDPTPGQLAYAAFEAALPERRYFPAPGWNTVDASKQRAWEAAAEAVLDHAQFPPFDLRLEDETHA